MRTVSRMNNMRKGFKGVLATIENEGFDYAFAHYSDFEEVKDEQFHQIRKEFLRSRKALIDYVGVDEDNTYV